MKILITGAGGQLGSELRALAPGRPEARFVFVDKAEMPLDDLWAVASVLDAGRPEMIVSAGAYTAVDRAESEPELADQINHQAVRAMAEWAAKNGAKLIHISTDYVFPGDSPDPLKEDDPTRPVNVYGQTKERAERAVLESGADAIIVRTAWLYSAHGANFVKTMLRLMAERDEIAVVADQIGSPTYARDLAKAVLHIALGEKWANGIYHFSNEGSVSWHGFAVAIRDMAGLECTINAVPTEQYPTPAKRPKYSLLDKTKVKDTFGIHVPEWRESLREMLGSVEN